MLLEVRENYKKISIRGGENYTISVEDGTLKVDISNGHTLEYDTHAKTRRVLKGEEARGLMEMVNPAVVKEINDRLSTGEIHIEGERDWWGKRVRDDTGAPNGETQPTMSFQG